MELKVKEFTFPEIIEFNFNELKEEITKKASNYMELVYTEDQIKDAKKDVATLRKFTKALSDERIKVKKECLKPYEDFETKIKELDNIVDKAIQNIDGQIKNYEEKKKEDKLEEILEIWNEANIFEWLNPKKVFDEKWLNASFSIKKVHEEIVDKIAQISEDLATLSKMPDFSFEAIEVYKDTLDINKAIQEGQKLADIQKRKAELEASAKKAGEAVQKMAESAEQTAESLNKMAGAVAETVLEKQWIEFKALLSAEDAGELSKFFKLRGIQYAPINSERKGA